MDRLDLWLARSKCVCGVWVDTWESEPDAELVWRRVEAALSLVKTYDRLCYDRLMRDIERIWVHVISSGVAQLKERMHACELDTRFVMADTTTPELLATVIVHEATHARLLRLGIGYEESLRARVEEVCLRQQIRLAAKLPNGENARQWAEGLLELCKAGEYWTDAALDERALRGNLEALRHLGAPQWLVRGFSHLAAVIRLIRRR